MSLLSFFSFCLNVIFYLLHFVHVIYFSYFHYFSNNLWSITTTDVAYIEKGERPRPISHTAQQSQIIFHSRCPAPGHCHYEYSYFSNEMRQTTLLSFYSSSPTIFVHFRLQK